jgi:signal transduction histidine kinase
LLLSADTPWAASFRDAVKRLDFQVHRLDSPFDALATISDLDPHLLVIGNYAGNLSVEEICDALRTPRQLRPLGIMLTTAAPLLPNCDVSELGIDEIIQADLPAAMYTGSLLQHFRLARMGRTLLLREQEILDSLPSPLFVLDRDLILWKANREFAHLMNQAATAGTRRLLGRPLAAIWSEENTEGLQALQLAVRNQSVSCRFRHWTGGCERVLSAQLTPLQFEMDRVLVDLRDVTEHEQSLLAEARRERLATIGNLSLGVAHEIQNPNTFSRVNAANLQDLFAALKPLLESLAQEHPDKRVGKLSISRVLEMVESAIDGVHKASGRIAEVLDGLKQFGKTDSGTVGAVDVRLAIREAALLTKHLVKDQCELALALPETPLLVQAAATQLSQVFVNLIENAVLALKSQRRTSSGSIHVFVERETRSQIVVAVSDNGPGIEAAIQDKIFRPYFTTRAQGEGTGLGLSISSDIMHRFGGTLSVRSKAGQGATFLVTLQRTTDHPTQQGEEHHGL